MSRRDAEKAKLLIHPHKIAMNQETMIIYCFLLHNRFGEN